MTPEGRVKSRIKQILERHNAYQFWPVQTGMGSRTLDCLGCHKGWSFAIEAKAPGKHLTEQQTWTKEKMEAAGCAVFVIATDDTLAPEWESLLSWLSLGSQMMLHAN